MSGIIILVKEYRFFTLITAAFVAVYIIISKVVTAAKWVTLTYTIMRYLKRVEKSDVYDRGTNFNPFVEFWEARPRFGDSASRDTR